MDFDTVLRSVGEFHRYQLFMYFLICLPASFPSAWSAFNHVFSVAVPSHWCHLPNRPNDTVDPSFVPNWTRPLEAVDGALTFSRCRQYDFNDTDRLEGYVQSFGDNISAIPTIACLHGWDYDKSTYQTTLVTEFNLVCDQSHLPVICTTVFYIGSFIGNILFGYVADKWGRRASFFSILAIQVIVGTASAFCPELYSFTVLRFFVGLTFPALYQIPFIIGMEMMGPPGRMFAGLVVCVFFGAAMCSLGIVAAFIREWRMLTIISNAPFAVLFVYWWILPESPRWLVSENRCEDAVKYLVQMAKCNGRTVDKDQLLEQCKIVAQQGRTQPNQSEQHSVADLFRTPNLRKKASIVSWVWIVNAVVYNGLTYNISNLGVNDYFAFAINGGVEIPAYLLIWPLLDRLGRRWLLALSMLLGGVACVSCMFVPPEQPWVLSGLAFFGKFSNSASFAIIYIFAGELYPTVVRAVGMGFSSMIAGSGLILGPYMLYLSNISRILPLLIMGVLTVTAGVASMFLPETLGSPLPQTINDAEQFGKGFNFFSCPKKDQSRRNQQLDTMMMQGNNHVEETEPLSKREA